MPHKNIRFHRRDNGGGCDRTPPKTGVAPGDHVQFIATPGTRVTLEFGNNARTILSPRPPLELVLDNPPGQNPGNAGVRYDIVTDAYSQLNIGVTELPFNLDVRVKDCGSGSSMPAAAPSGGPEQTLHSHDDIIMELC